MSQDVFKGKPVLEERYGDIDDSWTRFDIEEMLNVYGPTAAGNTASKESNNLPYEEMGVYGVEYENILMDLYTKDPSSILSNTESSNTDQKSGKPSTDKTLGE